MLLKLLLIAITVQNALSQSCITGQTWSKTGIGPCNTCTACSTTAPFVVQQCTATTDTYCSVCPYADQFSSNGLLANCKKCTTPCDNAKSYETTSCGATAGKMDRVCTACTPAKCSANAKMTTSCGGTTGTTNIMCACIAGLTWSKTGNEGAAANSKCLKCTVCTAKQFTATKCTAKSNTVCKACDKSCATCKATGPKACTSCPPPIQLQNGICAVCSVVGKTWSTTGNAPCTPCKMCPAGQTVKQACTAKSDTTCTAPCVVGTTWSTTGYEPCTRCNTCSGQTVKQACTAKSDATCGTACVVGKTWSTTGIAPCTQCKICPVGQTVKPCTAKSDTTCGTACGAGMFSTTGNKPCTRCKVCPAGQMVKQACTAKSDTTCTGCLTGKYLPAGKTAPGGCVPCKVCTAKQFISKPCTAASNTVCTACSANCAVCSGAKKCTACANTYSLQDDGSCKNTGCPTWTSMGPGMTVNNKNVPILVPLPQPVTLTTCQAKCLSVPTCPAIAFRQQFPVAYCYLHSNLSWPGKKVNPVITIITEYAVKRC